MSEIRHLTRKEQLEWLIPFLEEQKAAIQIDIDNAKAEYDDIIKSEEEESKEQDAKGKALILSKNKPPYQL